jgi:DNA-binding winged helix-turn-helix (wHTH) protein/tetratricopeptide (TPR) repeat protein
MVYAFDNWRIDAALREARRGGEPVALPRRVFDLVIYLIAQRTRAVGRDELVAAVWGRVDVADVQVSQLIARARRLLGDDAQAQAAIRTVAGFGYRWVMPVRELVDGAADSPSARAAPLSGTAAASSEMAAASSEAVSSAAGAASSEPSSALAGKESQPGRTPGRRRRALLAGLLAGALLLAVAEALRVADRRTPAPAASVPPDAIAVLPLELDAPADADWVQLGVMDLVAGRLRAAGLVVPPSDSVLVALRSLEPGPHDARPASTPKPVDEQRLNPILGTRRLVRGSARQLSDRWRVALEAPDAQGRPHRVEAEGADPIAAGRQAADLLLAALGHANAGETEDTAAPELLIQRSQAAILGGQFDTAQEILDSAAPAQHAAGRVQLQLAQVDFYRGRLDAAAQRLDGVLASDPGAELRARALTSRGMLLLRRGDCAAAEQSFGSALAAPSAVDATALAGRGLARSCQFAHAKAIDDLGLARLRLEAAGDRLGVARVDNYLGIADANRDRLETALGRFEAALATYESFGIADAQRAALSGLLDTHVLLLRWPEADRDAVRLAALRSRIADEGQRQTLDSDRARVLIGLGRHREAAELLDASNIAGADGAARRYLEAARAELAWRQGHADVAREAATHALQDWPPRLADARRSAIALLLQRAGGPSYLGTAEALDGPPGAGQALLHLAVAEAAVAVGNSGAEAHYRAAMEQADALGVPNVVAAVTASYVTWLLRQGRLDEAAALSGRIAGWSTQDFDCALLRVALFHARGDRDAWAAALEQARQLAGERPIAGLLAQPPLPASVRKVMN